MSYELLILIFFSHEQRDDIYMFAGMLVLSQSKHYGMLFFKLVAQLSLQEERERSKLESGKTGLKTEATNTQ